jgi:apolipoprotein N-acyltransferase
MAPTWIVCMALSALMPWFVFRQQTRTRAAAVAFTYFAAASAPIPWITDGPAIGIGLLLIASAILTLPWVALWHYDPRQRFWRIPAALLLSAVPPIGIINWASPLTAAGLLFPGTGLIGLVAAAFTEAIWPVHPKTVAAGILATNLLCVAQVQPMGIQALNTADSADPFQREEAARLAIHNANANLAILPEGAVRRWTEATESYWATTINHLKSSHQTALIGAGIPIPSSDQFHNSVITIGTSPTARFDQRIPIPIGMWKPLGPANGVPLNLAGPGILKLGEHRLAILICYEQLLVWPMVHSALEKPTLIVGISNAAWTKHTYIPVAQEACLQAWSRLFGIPYISAVNT